MQRQSWRTQLIRSAAGAASFRVRPHPARVQCRGLPHRRPIRDPLRGCAAVITELGATLRSVQIGGRDIVHGFPATSPQRRQPRTAAAPNRIRDGRYEFEGKPQQLALTEPARHNASHGLARYVPWRLLDHQDDAVTLQLVIYPQPGWPGTLQAQVTYRRCRGSTVDVEGSQLGDNAIPFGYGAHPYLTVGERVVDEVSLSTGEPLSVG